MLSIRRVLGTCFWPVTISFCKVKVKPQNANWVQDYMAVRSLLPVAHFIRLRISMPEATTGIKGNLTKCTSLEAQAPNPKCYAGNAKAYLDLPTN